MGFSSHDSGGPGDVVLKPASGAQGYRCTSHVRWAHSVPTSRLNRAKNTLMLVLKISGLSLFAVQRITTSKELLNRQKPLPSLLERSASCLTARPPTWLRLRHLDEPGAPCLLRPVQPMRWEVNALD